MNYGLWLSATGVVANSYRQDVIANNLANLETVGFKRTIPLFQKRLTEAQTRRRPDESNDLLDRIGGGLLCAPTMVDQSAGDAEETGNNLDVAVRGKGFLAVTDAAGKRFLTRDGRLTIDREGKLVLATSGERVLDNAGNPIALPVDVAASELQVGTDGQITRDGAPVGRIGLYEVADPSQLKKQGGLLFDAPDLDQSMKPADAGTTQLRAGFVERSNVDPAAELAILMDAQRQLEANANMIRYQDSTLARLVNDVGKIG